MRIILDGMAAACDATRRKKLQQHFEQLFLFSRKPNGYLLIEKDSEELERKREREVERERKRGWMH